HKTDQGRNTYMLALLGKAGIHTGPFYSQKHKDRNQHGHTHLFEQAGAVQPLRTPQIQTEQVQLKRKYQDDDKRENRNNLGHSNDGVDEGSLLHASQYHEMKQPYTDGRRNNGDDRIAVPKNRKKCP